MLSHNDLKLSFCSKMKIMSFFMAMFLATPLFALDRSFQSWIRAEKSMRTEKMQQSSSQRVGDPAHEPYENGFSRFVSFHPRYASVMLSHLENINQKPELLLNFRKSQNIKNKRLYIGSRIITLMDYQKTNRGSKFAYLMRHPTSANQVGSTVNEAVIHSFQLSVTGTLTDWFSFYSELLYYPEQSFGSGTITALSRNQIELRKGYAVLGDLNREPFYFVLGKMPTPFALTDSVSPFTSTSVWHAFGGLAYGALFGVQTQFVSGRFMLVQGGAQFRSHNTPVENTNVPSKTNNFVVDLRAHRDFGSNSNIYAGASYTRGSAYCQDFPVTHFSACRKNNPAWAVYMKTHLDQFMFIAEFVKTLKDWPGTHNPSPPLNIFSAAKVSAFDVGGRYTFRSARLPKPISVSMDFSEFRSGAKHAPWDRQSQFVVAAAMHLSEQIKAFTSFITTFGYSPLNFISGNDPLQGGAPGTTWSDSDARSHVFLLGFEASI